MDTTTLMVILRAEQPDYSRGKELQTQDLDVLAGLLSDADEATSARAVALAAKSSHDRKNEIVLQAAQKRSIQIRAAAAKACRDLDDRPRNIILAQLLNDQNGTVRQMALNSARGRLASGAVRSIIHLRCRMETDFTMMRLAEQVYNSLLAG